MEKLLKLAKQKVDSAEVFMNTYESNSTKYENGKISEIADKIQTGYCLRIIKNGKLGVSYTKNLLDREDLLFRALESLKGEVEAKFEFPAPHIPKEYNSYDSSIKDITTSDIVETAKEIDKYLSSKLEGQVNIYAGYDIGMTHIMNTFGLDVKATRSSMHTYPAIMYPRSYASISSTFIDTKINRPTNQSLDKLVEYFNAGMKEVSPDSGNISVIFTPDTIYSLIWRLTDATSAKQVYEKVSPLQKKIGERIFSEKLSVYNDPTESGGIGTRGFDDEGVPTRKLVVVENGVLKTFYNNLDYAEKLNVRPTGTGYKSAGWGGELVSLPVAPSLNDLIISPGDKSLDEMIAGLKRGIIAFGVLGAHSGNITNGDFSMGLNPALYIENGKIIGRVKNGMIAGNIYDLFQNVESIENEVRYSYMGKFPAICCNGVSFTVK